MSVWAHSQDQGRQQRERTRQDTHGVHRQLMGYAHRLRRTCKHDHEHVKLEGGRAKAAAPYPDLLCIETCKGLREQIEYDAKGLKCFGELSKKEAEDLIRDMVETAKDFIDEDIADETAGSHGDLPP